MRVAPTSPSVADQRRGELLEQHLVAEAPRAFAGRAFARRRGCRSAPRRAASPDEGARDLLAARVERHRRADVEQVVQPGQPRPPTATIGTSEALRPVAALLGRQAPGVALRLPRPRRPSSARAGTRRRSSPGAGACGRTCAGARARSGTPPRSSRRWCRPTACRRLITPPTSAGSSFFGSRGDDGVALLEQVVLQAVVDRLQRQRLAGQVRRAGVLAAAALGAGEGVEAVLPRQVARGAHAGLHVGLVGGGHQLLDVDRRAPGWPAGRGGRTASAVR